MTNIKQNELYVEGSGKKVFISGTVHKDLKDVRAEVAKSLKDWGFEPINHESADFPVEKGLHSHDVCLDNVKKCNIYLLIIGGRYGGTYSGNKYEKKDISITWYETEIAFQEGKRMLCFVREEVWNERPTYKINQTKGNKFIPFHVDDVRVFDFIDYVNTLTRDNWIDRFQTVVDLKGKLMKKLEVADIYSLPYFKRLQEGILK